MRGFGAFVLAISIAGCSSPPEPAGPDPSAAASLELPSALTLQVRETALAQLVARNALGRTVAPPGALVWTSSDPDVASVSPEGVVTANGRGTVTVTARDGGLRAETTVRVWARIRITSELDPYACSYCIGEPHALSRQGGDWWRIAVGDSLRLAARYVDVDGLPIAETPAPTWASSDAGLSVDAGGLVHGVSPGALSRIVATSPDGADTVVVETSDQRAGLPATLRLAHAVRGVGPVVFRHNKGAPVTLDYGAWIDLPITSGVFYAETEGLPLAAAGGSGYPDWRRFGGLVLEGDRLSLYAVGGECCGPNGGGPHASLASVWDRDDEPAAVAIDSTAVRLVQSWSSAGIVYLLEPGAQPGNLPQLCYFDPLTVTRYFGFTAVGVDFLLQPKYGLAFDSVRVVETPQPGRRTTYVVVQDAHGPPGLLGFLDPPGL